VEQLLAPKPLKDGGNLPEEWKEFKRQLSLFLLATEKNESADAVKVALLLRTIGPRGVDIYDSFTWEAVEHSLVFDRVCGKFDAFCAPRVNTVAQTHKLLTMRQGRKTIDEFITELHGVARLCQFDTLYDRMVLQALLLGIESDRTRRRLFERQDITLEIAVQMCRRMEATDIDLQAINLREEAHAVHHYQKKPQAKRKPVNKAKTDGKVASANCCDKCGLSHQPKACPAYGQKCHNCSKYNHYSKMCRSKRQSKGNNEGAHQVTTWNYSSDEEENTYSIHITTRDKKMLAKMVVRDQSVELEIDFQLDTAATCNILTLRDYNKVGKPLLEKTTTKLIMYDQTRCEPEGWCYLEVMDKAGTFRNLKFMVVDTTQNSLLSGTACLEMELIYLTESVCLVGERNLDDLLNEYEDVFTGMGLLPGEYKIELDDAVSPVQVRPRKIPLSMKADVEQEILSLESRGIITEVDEPTEWISHLQPIRKPNKKVRICVDPQNLNRAIKRNHTQMPTLEDVLTQLKDARCFSLCDAKDGFLQVKLAEDSTILTTFWTPFGKYKYLRMPFGISSAPEEFQRRLASCLHGLNGVTVVADDILIYGVDRQDHDRNLEALLKRARASGLRLNKEKCKFLQEELKYIGHLLTISGVKPDPSKVLAIQEMKPPTSIEGVRRFLGHVTYMSKFVNNLSAESEPLRRLLKGPKMFTWGTDQARSFEKLKAILVNAETLQYFDSNKPVVVQTDASTAGIGATLMQDGKPVAYASRSLTECESKYVPLELECLAILFGTEKFDQYIFGHPDVTIHTDRQPLPTIFKKPVFKASRRIQSMMLSLQRYSDIHIVWKRGRDQITADMLSRDAFMEQPGKSSPRDHVFQISERVTDRPLVGDAYTRLQRLTFEDTDLQDLVRQI
jgi:hypothetical protein